MGQGKGTGSAKGMTRDECYGWVWKIENRVEQLRRKNEQSFRKRKKNKESVEEK
jgi:arsenate reductase-like glutaredoxin family protein